MRREASHFVGLQRAHKKLARMSSVNCLLSVVYIVLSKYETAVFVRSGIQADFFE